MKRKLLHAVLVASMAVALSGCGNTSGINADAEKTQKATETENIEEERGTEVAAAEQKENTTGTPDENGNYLINGSFEEPDFSHNSKKSKNFKAWWNLPLHWNLLFQVSYYLFLLDRLLLFRGKLVTKEPMV